MSLDIGFIGLGNMGGPMARCLAAAGHRLHVFDLSKDAVARMAADTSCACPADVKTLGADCEIVITMLPEGKHVRQALLGDDGVVAGLKPGSILIDMTSASPVGTRELVTELEALGFPLVDAPVSGGVKKAAEGALAIMAGGKADIVAKVLPILEQMGKVFLTGGPGTGHAMKALNNYMSAANLATAAEAILTGERFGLEPKVMVDILNASSGRNTATDHKIPNFVLPRTFNSGFALKLMAKDIRLAVDIAHEVKTPARLLENLSAIYNEAEAQMGDGADNTDVVRYLESLIED